MGFEAKTHYFLTVPPLFKRYIQRVIFDIYPGMRDVIVMARAHGRNRHVAHKERASVVTAKLHYGASCDACSDGAALGGFRGNSELHMCLQIIYKCCCCIRPLLDREKKDTTQTDFGQ